MKAPIVDTRRVWFEDSSYLEYRVCFIDEYRDLTETEIKRFKFYGEKSLGRTFAERIYEKIPESYDLSDYDYLLPIPSKPSSIASRGYDHARLIGERLSELCQLPLATNILEALECRRQLELSRDERRENIKGKFRLIDPDAADWKSFLVLDDVLTTGATLDEVIKTLSSATPEPLDAVIFAKVPFRY